MRQPMCSVINSDGLTLRRVISISLLTFLLLLTMTKANAIETVGYQVIETISDDVEIRYYQPYLVAEVTVTGGFDDVGDQAFNILADYISGNNKSIQKVDMTAPVVQSQVQQSNTSPISEKIAMTSPVLQTQVEVDANQFAADSKYADQHTFSFVLPKALTLETAPVPNDDRINIYQTDPEYFIVYQYSGFWSQENFVKRENKLEMMIAERQFNQKGASIFARYDPPFMPWFLRRNEVWIPISYDQP